LNLAKRRYVRRLLKVGITQSAMLKSTIFLQATRIVNLLPVTIKKDNTILVMRLLALDSLLLSISLLAWSIIYNFQASRMSKLWMYI
jgi:hypothetical protein